MKRFLIWILCNIIIANSLATTTKSKKTKAHKKHHKLTTVAAHNDPLLAVVNTKPTATKRKTKPVNSIATANIPRLPKLYSYAGYAVDINNGEVLVNKNAEVQLSIASISKLMTAMVMLDSGADLDEYITISDADVDHLKNTYSRLKVGMQLRRKDLLLLALMSSENRAAHAIARTAYAGGINLFIQKMNAKAKALGMNNTQFFDPTGLTPQNKSTAIDLSKMVKAAYAYEIIREDTTTKGADVILGPHYIHHYINSDALVRSARLQIEVSKTGFINEAGHCLVLYAVVDNRPIAMAFLKSVAKNGRLADAMAVQRYVSHKS